MFPRRNIIALCVAALLSPLSAVLAQESVTSTTADAITTTQQSLFSPTITPTPVSESVFPSGVSTPVPTSTPGLGYYPTIPGQSYNDPTTNPTSAEENAAGADGTSDTFINIPLGAEIAIITVVVLAAIVGLVVGFLWYQRRRRQWEIEGRRRSLVPRFSVNQRGEFRMSRPVYIRDSITATPIIATAPGGRRASDGTASVASFDPVDLEKGNQKSEFENEAKAAGWKKVFLKK